MPRRCALRGHHCESQEQTYECLYMRELGMSFRRREAFMEAHCATEILAGVAPRVGVP